MLKIFISTIVGSYVLSFDCGMSHCYTADFPSRERLLCYHGDILLNSSVDSSNFRVIDLLT